MTRFRVGWQNFPGAPGISTHYLSTTIADFSAIRAFYNALLPYMPNGLQFQFPSIVDQIDETTGALVGSLATTPLATIQSSAPVASYSGASGAVIRWSTSGIWGGKRVAGRTYLVPMAPTAYATDGTLASATITAVQSAAAGLITAYGDGLKIWARPFAGKPLQAPRVGKYFTALGATVPDLAAVLRSRRT